MMMIMESVTQQPWRKLMSILEASKKTNLGHNNDNDNDNDNNNDKVNHHTCV